MQLWLLLATNAVLKMCWQDPNVCYTCISAGKAYCADSVQAAGWLLGAVLARQVLLSLGAVLSTIPFAPPVMTVLWVIPHPGALQVNNLDT
jgi:hypothetical protein